MKKVFQLPHHVLHMRMSSLSQDPGKNASLPAASPTSSVADSVDLDMQDSSSSHPPQGNFLQQLFDSFRQNQTLKLWYPNLWPTFKPWSPELNMWKKKMAELAKSCNTLTDSHSAFRKKLRDCLQKFWILKIIPDGTISAYFYWRWIGWRHRFIKIRGVKRFFETSFISILPPCICQMISSGFYYTTWYQERILPADVPTINHNGKRS